MTKLTFYGATGTVTGSRFMLEIQDQRFLIDCGLFQGPKANRLRNWDPFPVAPKTIDKVFLTHAHIDHTGYLPRFCHHGFSGPVYCTYPTKDLCEILLRDSAKLQEEDAFWANKKKYSKHDPALPLYTSADAENALKLFKPIYYGENFFLNDNLRVKFRDAGHILGSSFIDFKTGNGNQARKIVFGGDLGRPDLPILRDPSQAYNVDYLVLESTYGNRLHEGDTPIAELARVINQSFDRGGVLVIPAFAVGRTQTLLYLIRELEEQGKIPAVPVYLDSPMAIDATDIFRQRISEQDLTSRVLTLQGKKIYSPKQLHFCKSRKESQEINKVAGRAIIVSASGMATGGRIVHHLLHRLPHKKNTVLFIGYQAQGTRGRTILEGKPTVKIHGQRVPIKAHIESLSGFSGHADYNEILAWLMAFNKPPQQTFLVHGEPEASEALAEKIRRQFGWEVVIPQFGESFELEI